MVSQQPSLTVADSSEVTASRSMLRVRVIEPGTVSLSALLKELWQARELLYFLTWRDIKVRYKQTALGVVWAILQPVISMIVLSLVFGRMASLGNFHTGAPYPIFVYAALLPWNFFASTLSNSSNSVVSNAGLISKVRFPRLALPLASTLGELVDLGLAFVVLLGLMLYYHVPFSASLLVLPLLTLGVGMVGLGLGAFFAALTVKYRDFRFIVPFLTQIWMFLTPVIYPSKVFPAAYRFVLTLNPLNGWVSAYRAAILGQALPLSEIGWSAVISVLVLGGGVYYFRRTERRFAEII